MCEAKLGLRKGRSGGVGRITTYSAPLYNGSMQVPFLAFVLLSHRPDAIDRWVQTRMARDHIPGMAMGVYRNGKAVKVKAYGKIDLEHGVAATKDSPFEICSITKQFTSVALLLLAEDGKLSLNDPLTRWFPDADVSWKEVRIADVLHHTSGLADPLSEGGFDRPWPEVLEEYEKRKPIAPPRTAWAYNNSAYSLMGDVILKASGEPIWTFVKRRILDPLDMTHTFPNSPAVQSGRVRGYTWNGKGYVNARPLDTGLAAGALVSTPDDLNRWSEALRKGTILRSASRAAMLVPARLDSGEEASTMLEGGYGLGVFLNMSDGKTIEMHSGGWETASAQLTRLPDEGITVVLLTNSGGQEERPWWGLEIAGIVTRRNLLPSFEAATDPDPARTAKVRAQLESDLAKADPTAPKLRGLAFVRAIAQGATTKLLYRGNLDVPMLFVIAEHGGKLELEDAFAVPKP